MCFSRQHLKANKLITRQFLCATTHTAFGARIVSRRTDLDISLTQRAVRRGDEGLGKLAVHGCAAVQREDEFQTVHYEKVKNEK